MKKCPRCHTSMLLEFGSNSEGYARAWKCLGCGREVLADPERQAEDDRLKDMIRGSQPARL
ncbi:MAG TPA: hypothetical protein VFB58_18070 [Chloroflexota bacterium]|nr:hypothetical protein [Chloroflexota bacterium]